MDGGLTVLVEAKKEYMAQLCSVLCPQMIETFELMYSEAQKMSKGKDVLKQFQKLLREVKNWNNTMIEEHEAKLKNTCGWFNDLISAVFVSYIRILSSVRLNSNSADKKMNVKMPGTDILVHGCFKAAANDLYRDPYVYHEDMSEYQRDIALTTRFVVDIEETVKKLLPVQEILALYMKASEEAPVEEQEEEEEPPVEEEEPVLEEEPPTTTEEAPAAAEEGTEIPAPAPEVDTSKDAIPPMAPIQPGDVKNINVTGASADDDVLFPDARD
jgi:hypothetical protein